MHTKLRALFDEHEKPTHAAKRDIHDDLSRIVRLAGRIQKQLIEYRTLTSDAVLSPDHDPRMTGKLEAIHQTFAATESHAAVFMASARDLGRDFEQLDRYMAECAAEITAYLAKQQQTSDGEKTS